jgi:hypothetical protein
MSEKEKLALKRMLDWAKRSGEMAASIRARHDCVVADAAETAHFTRQLEQILSKTFDVQYPLMRSRDFFPVDNAYNEAIETITYRQYDRMGEAKLIANFSDDLPRATIHGTEFTSGVATFGLSYELNVLSMRQAQLTNTPLQEKSLDACVSGIALSLDDAAAFGVPEKNIKGFLNHSDIEVINAATGDWTTADPDNILADIREGWYKIYEDSKEVIKPDTLLIPSSIWKYLQQPRTTQSDTTIAQYLMQNLEGLKNMDGWYKLDTAGAAGGERAVMYKKDPALGWIADVQAFRQHSPQEKNLSMVVNTTARTGGAIIPYPVGFKYMDGIGA